MALRKRPSRLARQNDQGLSLLDDVREVPFEVREDGQAYRPVVALWVHSDNGQIVGCFVDKPGHPAKTLVQALGAPVPLPGQAQPLGSA